MRYMELDCLDGNRAAKYVRCLPNFNVEQWEGKQAGKRKLKTPRKDCDRTSGDAARPKYDIGSLP